MVFVVDQHTGQRPTSMKSTPSRKGRHLFPGGMEILPIKQKSYGRNQPGSIDAVSAVDQHRRGRGHENLQNPKENRTGRPVIQGKFKGQIAGAGLLADTPLRQETLWILRAQVEDRRDAQ